MSSISFTRWLAIGCYDAIAIFVLSLALGIFSLAVCQYVASGFLLYLTGSYLYYIPSWYYGGQTLGAKAWHCRLLPCSLWQCHLRWLGLWLSLLGGGIGHLWRCWDPHQRTWYDSLSQTRLVFQTT